MRGVADLAEFEDVRIACSFQKEASVILDMLLAIEPSLLRSSGRMPRTSTPEALCADDASADNGAMKLA